MVGSKNRDHHRNYSFRVVEINGGCERRRTDAWETGKSANRRHPMGSSFDHRGRSHWLRLMTTLADTGYVLLRNRIIGCAGSMPAGKNAGKNTRARA